MPLKRHKPTSPGRRFATFSDFAEITRSEPEKSLTEGISKSGGRNSNRRKTSRHRGGGAQRRYPRVGFQTPKEGGAPEGAPVRDHPHPHPLHPPPPLAGRRERHNPCSQPPLVR